LVSSLVLSGAAFAATSHQANSKNSMEGQSAAQQPKVMLFAAPQEQATVLERSSPTKRYIPIYSKGEWLKVGDPSNGKIGWLNKKQYNKAVQAWYKPDVQTFYVSNEKTKNGKAQVNIVAYKNGKKLDPKEAEALYKKIQKEQRHEWSAMNRFNKKMNRFFDREMRFMDDEDSGPFVWGSKNFTIQPMIIVTQRGKAPAGPGNPGAPGAKPHQHGPDAAPAPGADGKTPPPAEGDAVGKAGQVPPPEPVKAPPVKAPQTPQNS